MDVDLKPGDLDAIAADDLGLPSVDHWHRTLAGYIRRTVAVTGAGRDCPACPASRGMHDGWGCPETGCPMPIHSLALTPVRREPRDAA